MGRTLRSAHKADTTEPTSPASSPNRQSVETTAQRTHSKVSDSACSSWEGTGRNRVQMDSAVVVNEEIKQEDDCENRKRDSRGDALKVVSDGRSTNAQNAQSSQVDEPAGTSQSVQRSRSEGTRKRSRVESESEAEDLGSSSTDTDTEAPKTRGKQAYEPDGSSSRVQRSRSEGTRKKAKIESEAVETAGSSSTNTNANAQTTGVQEAYNPNETSHSVQRSRSEGTRRRAGVASDSDGEGESENTHTTTRVRRAQTSINSEEFDRLAALGINRALLTSNSTYANLVLHSLRDRARQARAATANAGVSNPTSATVAASSSRSGSSNGPSTVSTGAAVPNNDDSANNKRREGPDDNGPDDPENPRKRVRQEFGPTDSAHGSLTATAHNSSTAQPVPSIPLHEALFKNDVFLKGNNKGKNAVDEESEVPNLCGVGNGDTETAEERDARLKKEAATGVAYEFLKKKWAHYSGDLLATFEVAAQSPRACSKLFRLVPLHVRKALAEGISGACKPLFDHMPVEVAQVIFRYMDVSELARLSETSKSVYRLISDAEVWRTQAEKYGYQLPKDIPEGRLGMKYVVMQAYKKHKLADKNWLRSNYRCTQVRTESAGVYCVQYDENKIVSGSRDKRIRIWDPTTDPPSLKHTLPGHTGSVLCLQFDHEKIISGSSDTTLRGWDLKTMKQKWNVRQHGMSVLNLQFDDTTLVTCSKDAKVIVWNLNGLKKPEVRYTLEGHAAPVNVVRFDSRFIVSASGDSTVKVWDLHTAELVRTMEGHARGIACLCFQGDLVVTGSSDESIKLWNVLTGECLRTFQGHTDLVRCIYMDGDRIVSGGYDKTIRVWDIKTGHNTATFREHRHRVFKLQFDRYKMVSSSHDDSILVWDFTQPSLSEPQPLPTLRAPVARRRQ